jgi:hypothetical protein
MRPASATPAKKEFIFVTPRAKVHRKEKIEQESKKLQTTKTSHNKTKKENKILRELNLLCQNILMKHQTNIHLSVCHS